ncbi:hypothetical protein [Microbacterium allomyrinae]|uniref:DUF5134 domain-containing protein n=1 Tax=Microbacterium allomyrinae TaxID=2830666 RepID=A0A9X1LVJ8_9MICO|nr:hypothetical protein [Microbacterium allomyrinae]MCC2032496.1 hypothetical protein [Microbacterium allomyrinae]
MAELLHTGALAATALSTCCAAAAGPRARVRELALALIMLAAMADVVGGWGLLAPVWWAALLVVVAMGSAVSRARRAVSSADRSARAMDALGAILMAALLLLMSGGTVSTGAHAGHGVSSSALVWTVVAASVLFAAASVHMGVKTRMPQPPSPARARVLRRIAPLAMGASVLLMAAVVVV